MTGKDEVQILCSVIECTVLINSPKRIRLWVRTVHYTIYKITHIDSGKIYIGKHKTDNIEDGYMGSGKMIKRAIKKYGIDRFNKDILHVFDNEQQMNDKEAELVNEEFVLRTDSYNLCVGGQGGFSYVKLNPEQREKQKRAARKSMNKLHREGKVPRNNNPINARKALKEKYPNGTFAGKTHSEESKRKISLSSAVHQRGSKNSQYGTRWITDGTSNKKIKNVDSIPEGWYRGRITKRLAR